MECPNGHNLQGAEIPREYREKGLYGPYSPEDPPKYYGREIMVEIRGVYDGGLYYVCPDCGVAWHRWESGELRRRAQPYIDHVNAGLDIRNMR